MKKLLAMVWIVFSFVCSPIHSQAKAVRSHSAISDFKREHPCPANGAPRGKCNGYVIDHIKPLCKGGIDGPSNMQWQTVSEAKAKDRWECKK